MFATMLLLLSLTSNTKCVELLIAHQISHRALIYVNLGVSMTKED
jgi:hypothetical protein